MIYWPDVWHMHNSKFYTCIASWFEAEIIFLNSIACIIFPGYYTGNYDAIFCFY